MSAKTALLKMIAILIVPGLIGPVFAAELIGIYSLEVEKR